MKSDGLLRMRISEDDSRRNIQIDTCIDYIIYIYIYVFVDVRYEYAQLSPAGDRSCLLPCRNTLSKVRRVRATKVPRLITNVLKATYIRLFTTHDTRAVQVCHFGHLTGPWNSIKKRKYE